MFVSIQWTRKPSFIVMNKTKNYFIQKLKEIYSGQYIPEINYALNKWDWGPDYIKKYYDVLSNEDQNIFREAIKEAFMSGNFQQRRQLLPICQLLRIKEITSVMLKYGEEYIRNDFQFNFDKENQFKFSPKEIVGFLKNVSFDYSEACSFIKLAEASKNYKKGY